MRSPGLGQLTSQRVRQAASLVSGAGSTTNATDLRPTAVSATASSRLPMRVRRLRIVEDRLEPSAILTVVMVGMLAAAASGCGRDTTAPSPTPAAVSVSGSVPAVGGTAQLVATATLSGGVAQNVTGQATWQSSNTAVATVTSAGIVTVLADGEADISATFQSVTGKLHLVISTVPSSFGLSGNVTDAATGAALSGFTVQVIDGPNAGKTATTDSAGRYAIPEVAKGTTTVAASGASYDTQSRTVTIAGDTQLDFALRRTAPCVTLMPASASVGAGASSGQITVDAPASCTWTAASRAAFLTITGRTNATGSGVVTYDVAANPTGTIRSGSLTVGDQLFTVTQSAACVYAVSPMSIAAAPGDANQFLIAVTTGDSCSWTAASQTPFIILASTPNGTGSGSVLVNMASNLGNRRTGTLIVAGQTVTVVQQETNCTPLAVSVPGGAGLRSVMLTCSVLGLDRVPDVDWITGFGTNQGGRVLEMEVEFNPGGPRTGHVLITSPIAGGSFTVTVNQAGMTR